MKKNTSMLLAIILIVSYACNHNEKNEQLMLYPLSTANNPTSIITNDAKVEQENINGKPIIKVKTGNNIPKPGIIIKEPQEKAWDLEGYFQVKADVSNTSNEDMQVEMFVGNDPDGLTRWYCSDYVDLLPGEAKTITVDLSWTPWVFNPQLNIVGMRGIPGKIKTDLKAIDQVSFNVRYATSPSSFAIHKLYATGKTEERDTSGFFPFVDEYGQYKHKEWKNKVNNDDELKKSLETELAQLKLSPEAKDRNKYGGWTAGPQLKATGFFRTEKVNNKWWMVDPEGRLFWTAGINCVSSGTGTTGVEYREDYFENLPNKESEFTPFYGRSNWASHGFYKDHKPYDTYNFIASNLYKKNGNNWLDEFRTLTHKRLRSWGITTIGFMSDRGLTEQQKTPYVGSVWIRNTPTIEGSSGFWGKFHDVFDPGFREAVRSSMERQKNGAGDPWCIGFFIDNEMSWGKVGSLSIGTLKSPATQPAKIEFIHDLKLKYRTVESLNKQWQTTHHTWEELLASETIPNEEFAHKDLVDFYTKITQTYFRIVSEELERIAPHQNYLGCRFAWANNDITISAAAKYCDIVSFNKYEYSVEHIEMPEGVDKPIMIGEFHFGALDRGMLHVGVKKASNQTDRGIKYQEYIQGALRNSYIVGAHWFQYTDQPLTGRGDGENYNVGLVNVCNIPHYELIEKVQETCYGMYEYRTEN